MPHILELTRLKVYRLALNIVWPECVQNQTYQAGVAAIDAGAINGAGSSNQSNAPEDIARRNTSLLSLVHPALKRPSMGDFGDCLHGQHLILQKRLFAMSVSAARQSRQEATGSESEATAPSIEAAQPPDAA
jgi:hypothetical protein